MKPRLTRWLLAALVLYAASVLLLAWWLPPEPVARFARGWYDSLIELNVPLRQAVVNREIGPGEFRQVDVAIETGFIVAELPP